MIILIRHGSTDYNEKKLVQGWTDIPLNREGRNQIYSLCKKICLINTKWDAVISSDLKRALESGEILADFFSIPLFTYKGLRERKYGEYEGLSLSKVHELREVNDQISEKGGETKQEFLNRISHVMKNLNDLFEEKNIIVLTHGAFIKNYAREFLHLEVGKISNAQILCIDEGMII